MKHEPRKPAFCALVMFLAFVFLARGAMSAEKRNVIGWVGLWNSAMIKWAENENQLNALCPESLSETERSSCKETHLEPRSWNVPVFSMPSAEAVEVGRILIEITPGRAFEIAYQPAGTQQAITFIPDLYDQDWGYGPYFHQTVLKDRGDWVLLPENPFSGPVWINVRRDLGVKHLLTLEVGNIYRLNDKKIVVVEKNQEGIFVRPEQPADMWCEGGDPPPLKTVEPSWLGNESLYDADGHLKLVVAYTRGC